MTEPVTPPDLQRITPAAAPPPLPYTVEAGTVGVRLALRNLRRRGWILLVIVAFFAVAGMIGGNALSGLLSGLFLTGLVLLVLLVVLGVLWLGRHQSVTVTHTELIVKRVRRRVLPRAELAEVLVGFLTDTGDLDPAPQLAFVTDQHRLFAMVTTSLWPVEGLDAVLAALGTDARVATRADRRMLPFPVRRPRTFGLIGGLVLFVAIIGVIVAVDTFYSHQRDEAAADAERGWPSYARTHLTHGAVPGLYDASARTFVDDDRHVVFLDVDAGATFAGPEIRPALAQQAWRAACAYRPDTHGQELRTELTLDFYTRHAPEPTRSVDVECAEDDGRLRAWLDAVAGDPMPKPGVERVDAVVTDETRGLQVRVFMASDAVGPLRTALRHVCDLAPHDVGLDAISMAEGSTKSFGLGGTTCARLAGSLREWRSG